MKGDQSPTTSNAPDTATVFVDFSDLLAIDATCLRALRLLHQRPTRLPAILAWSLRGKHYLRQRVATLVPLDAASLPYRSSTLERIRAARQRGTATLLVARTDHALAESVAAHLGLFDGVHAAQESGQIAAGHRLSTARAGPRDYLRELRMHQWAKNALLAVPILPILRSADLAMLLAVVSAIAAFNLVASAVYVVNDLLDLEADCLHPGKSRRPLAAGLIPVSAAMALAAALLCGGFALGLALLPWQFNATLLLYLALSSVYTLKLKERALLDIFSLAMLYMLRILAGSFAIRIPPSFWILCFALFIFTSLALAKRYTELQLLKGRPRAGDWARGYSVSDQPFVLIAGVCSGQVSVLVLSLYLHDPQVANHYGHPRAIWILSPLLFYWITRVWLIAYHGRLHDDPIVFALRDRVSRMAAAVIVVSFVIAARGP